MDARAQETVACSIDILDALKAGDVRRIGAATTRNFFGPLQTIIPWATTYYTETLIDQVRANVGADFWGFWMLGGMSGGGMGFIFAPERKAEAPGPVCGHHVGHQTRARAPPALRHGSGGL